MFDTLYVFPYTITHHSDNGPSLGRHLFHLFDGNKGVKLVRKLKPTPLSSLELSLSGIQNVSKRFGVWVMAAVHSDVPAERERQYGGPNDTEDSEIGHLLIAHLPM